MTFNNVLLENLTENVKKLKNQKWIDDNIIDKDIEILKKEATDVSPFDKLNLKKYMFEAYENKTANFLIKKCKFGRIVILTENSDEFYPWDTWGKILEWFGSFYQIYIYSSKQKRILPDVGVVGPEHVNGGYTYPCRKDCVVIYRYEEATRVLIHELLHASCTDNHENSVEVREAATETWAELFLIAILSKGNISLAKKLWKIQDHHIQDLNYTLYNFYNVKTLKDYASRYTILREKVLNSFGFYLDLNYTPKRIKSSRFTSILLDNYLT